MSSSHPEEHLTLDNKEIIWACEHYDIGNFKKINTFFQSKTNVNMLVETSQGKFVLRSIRDPVSKERVNYIQDILLFLKNYDVPVINSIKAQDGNYISTYNNKTIQVTPYIKASPYDGNTNQIKSCSKMLNKFHAALKDYQQGPLPSYSIHPTNQRLEEEMNKLLAKKDKHSTSSLSTIEKLYWKLLKASEKKNAIALPKTIIHDDWHPRNLLYDKNGYVAYILDYDGFQRAERIYDIAYTLYLLGLKKKNFCKIFLENYGDLITEQRDILPLLIAKVSFWFIIQYRDYPKHLNSSLSKYEPIIEKLMNSSGTSFLD